MASTPVSEFIWTELQRSFQSALNHLVKDVATTLGQSPDPLKKALRGTINIHLVEDGAESFTQRCTYMCQHADTPAFLTPCGEPIMWLNVEQMVHRCPKHVTAAAIAEPPLSLTPLTGGYAYASDGTVYNGLGEPCGFYADEVLTLFETV